MRPNDAIEFLCKFEGHSYRKLEWLPLSVMQEAAEGKLRGKGGLTLVSLFQLA